MQILLTNYTGDRKHIGCQLTSGALEALLKTKFGAETQIEREQIGQRHGDVDMLLGSLGISIRRWKLRNSTDYSAHRAADLVVVNGEGSIHSNNTKLGTLKAAKQARFHRLLDVAAVAKSDKPVWVVNHSTSCDDAFGKWLSSIYKNVEHIAVSEPASRDYLKRHGYEKAIQSADAIFSLHRPPSTEGVLTDRIVLTDSSAFGRTWDSNTISQMQGLVENLKKSGDKLAYFSLYTDDRQKQHAELLDIPFANFPSGERALSELASAKLLVTGRFHAAVFATKMGVPFVSFAANTHKINGLRQLLGGGSVHIDLQKDSPEAMAQTVANTLAKREALSAYLVAQENRLRELARKNVGL